MSLDKLKQIITDVLKDVDVVIGYKQGFDLIHATPCFVTKPEQVDEISWSPLCVQNLASFLPSLKKKVGVVVKGCDSRTIVQYMQEGLIDRTKVVVIGIPCTGVVSVKETDKVKHEPIEEVKKKLGGATNDGTVTVKTPSGEKKKKRSIPLKFHLISAKLVSIQRLLYSTIWPMNPLRLRKTRKACSKTLKNLTRNRWKRKRLTGKRSLTGVSDAMHAGMHVPCAYARTAASQKAVNRIG